MAFHKIINDPVYGFITIDDDLVNQPLHNPYQQLKNIPDTMAQLVYPGALHVPGLSFPGSLSPDALCTAGIGPRQRHWDNSSGKQNQDRHTAAWYRPRTFSHALEHVLAEGFHHRTFADADQRTEPTVWWKLQIAIDDIHESISQNFCTSW